MTRQFEQHFDRTFNPASLNLTQARETLEQIDRVTGNKPALIYAVFVPATLESQATAQAQSPQPTDQLELILVTAQGKTIRKRVERATRDRVLKLRQAQLAMLKGEVRVESGKLLSPQGEVQLPPELARFGDKKLTHPYYWAAFTIVGNPW